MKQYPVSTTAAFNHGRSSELHIDCLPPAGSRLRRFKSGYSHFKTSLVKKYKIAAILIIVNRYLSLTKTPFRVNLKSLFLVNSPARTLNFHARRISFLKHPQQAGEPSGTHPHETTQVPLLRKNGAQCTWDR